MLENLEANLKAILSRDIDVLRNRLSKLSPREMEICELIRDGKTSKEISSLLSLSPTTVQTHRQQIRRKLEIAGKEVNLRSRDFVNFRMAHVSDASVVLVADIDRRV